MGITQLINDFPGFSTFLKHPFIKNEEKKSVLKNLFKDKSDTLFLNFLFFLLDKKRIKYLPQIANEFCEMADKKLGRLQVGLLTALPIDNEMKEKVRQTLENQYKMKVYLKDKIDPQILGGMVLSIGNRVMDGSLKTRSTELKNHLLMANFN
jgi:F-type H+-transporting ATPase subunit delta